MGIGRFFCVALPFILTAISLICLLIVGLAGVTSSSIPLMTVTPQNLSISIVDFQAVASNLSSSAHLRRDLSSQIAAATAGSATNITAATLKLADNYQFSLWNYVATTGTVAEKSAPKFNYASNFTDVSALTSALASAGLTSATIPDGVQNALKVFATLIKWTEVVFIVAVIATAGVLLLGLISFCSRVGSCCTWLVSGIASLATIAFAVMGTVLSSIVVGTLQVGDHYGLKSRINTAWLAIAYLGVAASVAAAFFWLLTICCCSPEKKARREKHKSTAGDYEKPYGQTGYQRVHDPLSYGAPAQQSYQMGSVKPQHAGAYEPYSHHAV